MGCDALDDGGAVQDEGRCARTRQRAVHELRKDTFRVRLRDKELVRSATGEGNEGARSYDRHAHGRDEAPQLVLFHLLLSVVERVRRAQHEVEGEGALGELGAQVLAEVLERDGCEECGEEAGRGGESWQVGRTDHLVGVRLKRRENSGRRRQRRESDEADEGSLELTCRTVMSASLFATDTA